MGIGRSKPAEYVRNRHAKLNRVTAVTDIGGEAESLQSRSNNKRSTEYTEHTEKHNPRMALPCFLCLPWTSLCDSCLVFVRRQSILAHLSFCPMLPQPRSDEPLSVNKRSTEYNEHTEKHNPRMALPCFLCLPWTSLCDSCLAFVRRQSILAHLSFCLMLPPTAER